MPCAPCRTRCCFTSSKRSPCSTFLRALTTCVIVFVLPQLLALALLLTPWGPALTLTLTKLPLVLAVGGAAIFGSPPPPLGWLRSLLNVASFGIVSTAATYAWTDVLGHDDHITLALGVACGMLVTLAIHMVISVFRYEDGIQHIRIFTGRFLILVQLVVSIIFGRVFSWMESPWLMAAWCMVGLCWHPAHPFIHSSPTHTRCTGGQLQAYPALVGPIKVVAVNLSAEWDSPPLTVFSQLMASLPFR